MDKKEIDIIGKDFPISVIGKNEFWVKATPTWFKILGWVLIIGAIKSLYTILNAWPIRIVYAISYLALFMYLQAYIYNLDFKLSFIKNKRSKRAVSMFLSFLLLLLILELVNTTITGLNISCK